MRRRSLVVALAVAMGLSGPVLAEGPKPFPDFTFKRVTPPKKGERPKLPQIEPRTEPAVAAKPTDREEPATRNARYDWFWQAVSPDMEGAGPARLEPALNSLSNPPQGQGVAAPRLGDLLRIARDRQAALLLNTVGTRVSPALALAVISVESGGRPDAKSEAGAQGLMQLIPTTAARFGVTDSLDPQDNIKGGIAYLDWLLKEFEGDAILALAAYNAGEGAVKKHQGVPPFAETRDYVPKVLAAFAVARALCKTPPQLISDGCVFNLGS
ncbi:lytic transglycosylase domain-containing protein [Lutimaribacter sp. EGI FJ00015]|uniref:Lytic transglycosylase domain-containing protein n=1 Tax=Lutimaribacter degradans TaxID=2945989 RepID=A0ACC5ZR37_9RHOB|nr:lytic transglycosylase domain-containing protein [Lutimaribacter sp. EGI FJ00013]MCM2560620.1 lytic transglycosylase domain-containing protein [Lutimaribacter sp. EGI FJ00013]MCO0612437.1 lytic transglycosylase domain-containing protein [Lutimaribacter sp. EGI FJ00015]MCO0634444.1 lytic transglycosylase domain-containing protein [Lutimaribacter sp. EGI FJ00014]